MPATLYPNQEDLRALLSDGGTVPSGSDSIIKAALEASIEGIEKSINMHMLAGKNVDNTTRPPATRPFYQEQMNEEPQGMIQLNLGPYGGIARIDTVIFNIPNAAPQTLVELTDWWKQPTFATDEGQPYTWLRVLPYATLFFGLLPLYNAHIDVTGLWGWPQLPQDMWLAMLYGAALQYFEGSWAGVKVGAPTQFPVKRWTAPGGASTEYNTGWWLERRQMWMGTVDKAINNYRRLTIA